MNIAKNIYTCIQKGASPKNRALLSRIAFSYSGKPLVKPYDNKTNINYPSGNNGGLIISIDFEMAWAFRYSKRNVDPLKMAQNERAHVPILVSLFENFGISVTWATVGHLFLESCSRGDHDWMQRIPHFDDHWRFTTGDWFAHDPYTDYRKDSAWYAPDLIELILKSSVAHEFGCHTFSHIDCSTKNCPSQVFDDELIACKNAASKWGLSLKSFVFPGGTAGNYDILKKHGFEIYRKRDSFELAYPFRDEDHMLVTVSTSSFSRGYDWSAEYYISRFIKMIDKAIKTKTVAHLWLHPSVDRWTLDNVIPQVLSYAAEQREKGLLWIGTMGQIADHINQRSL